MLRKLLTFSTVVALTLAGLVNATPALADDCSTGGAGTSGDPYVICNTTDFNQISAHPDWQFKLGANLDFTNYNPPTTDLDGELDGNGKTIRNFNRNITTNYGGLFRFISYTGFIHDLKLENITFNVTDGAYAAPLAGILYGRAERIEATGNIETNSQYTTGLVGIIWGDATLADSLSSVAINRSESTYAYGLAAILWGDDPQQGGDGIPQVSNSLYLGPGNLSALPYYEPWFDPRQSEFPPESSCDVVSGVFTLSDGFLAECSQVQEFEQFGEATGLTEGYSDFSSEIWNFGDSSSLPILRQFPKAPSSPRGLTVGNSDFNFVGQVVPGFDGGSAIMGYEVEARRAGGTWHSYDFQFNEPTLFSVDSLTPGAYYDVRVRALNAFGKSDWLATTESTIAQYTSDEVLLGNGKILSVQSGLLDAPYMSAVVSLQNGLQAVAFTETLADGTSLVGMKVFTTSGRVIYESSAEVFGPTDAQTVVGGAGRLGITVSPKGTLAIAYVVKTTLGHNVTTSVKVRQFKSTVILGDESALPARTIDKTSTTCNNDADCGYENIQLISDVSGKFAVIATFPTANGKNLVASSQLSYGNWVTKSLEAEASVESASIVPGKSGFLVGWVNRATTSTAKYSVLKKSGTSAWSAASTMDIQPGNITGTWIRRTASLATFVWNTNLANSDVIKVRDYDLVKYKFPKTAAVVISTLGVVRSMSASASQRGELSIVLDQKERESNSRTVKLLTLPPSNVLPASSTFGDYVGADYLDLSVVSSPIGTPLVSWSRETQDGSQIFVAVKGALGFNVRELPGMSPTSTQPRVKLLPTGDVLYVSIGASGTRKLIEMNTILTAKAPELSSDPSIAGETRVGKTLTADLGSWLSYSVVTKQTLQWWRCSANFAGYLDESFGCSPIKGATKSKYKTTKSDKGKILGFTMEATNFVGESSHSTALNAAIG